MSIELKLIGKPGCHLCDDAREVVLKVLQDFPDVDFVELNMLDHPDLVAKYSEEIPVVLINDSQFSFWRVDAERLRDKLNGLM